MDDAASRRPAWRFDLEGLRGVAVLLVVVYHVWAGRVSGGVDVFLTLSGFFLALTVLGRARALGPGRPRLRSALRQTLAAWRRILRRLIPAAVVTLAGVTVAMFVVLPRVRWEETARQVLASLTYAQNWYLAGNEQDYEAAGLAVSPVQHFWSLSVQGQLFLAVPLAGLLAVWAVRLVRPGWSARPVLLALFGAGALASFGYALASVRVNQPVAYYDTLARAWEPLAGALAALLLPWIASGTARAPGWLRVAMGYAGIAAVASCGLMVDGGRLFPGAWAAWPVLATLALVVAGVTPTRVGVDRLLSARVPRWLGDHAYALYLWHWPVLIGFLAHTGRTEAGPAAGAGILAASLLLAMATKWLVEDPVRERPATQAPSRPVRRLPALAASTTIAVALLASVVAPVTYLVDLERDRAQLGRLVADGRHPGAAAVLLPSGAVPTAALVPPVHLARGDRPDIEACLPPPDTPDIVTCTFGVEGGSRVVHLVGSSHMIALLPAFEEVALANDLELRTTFRLGCPWGLKPLRPQNPKHPICRAWSAAVSERLVGERPDLVVSTGTRPYRGPRPGDYVPQEYPTSWWPVADAGIPLVMLRDTPWLGVDAPSCVEEAMADGADAVIAHCTVPREELLSADPFAGAPALPDLAWIDLTDHICRPTECRAVEGNVLVYRDANHLTSTFSRTLAPVLERRLGDVTGWWGPVAGPAQRAAPPRR